MRTDRVVTSRVRSHERRTGSRGSVNVHGDPLRGRAALAALDFYAHADLFMTPPAALADIVLPVASCFERESLKIGFEISAEAQSHVQLRQAIVAPPSEVRSDTDVVLGLAARAFSPDAWMHVATESPSSNGGRGLSVAHVHDRDGTMLATSIQETLMVHPDARA
ncbi:MULTISPECIES: molybdopterin-dependent oxidoreductase [unclassified Bradyrhizobium]|uniref:molybdopterin-dependent oxidoreductase n=1 Tax=unclassified Bradyrhizobium TaxID=2631580 RepID=UPI00247B1987|nr:MULTISPECIES: molybdopterin-dependent oxidoreductase [unclassified Bradyrhizobium]WGS18521.1 thioesterase family protein [Bradyrhizobium sp. ISRA463]WGS25346.1 thioesterase family protein [Bradyrhizobium sp. ISRA464]